MVPKAELHCHIEGAAPPRLAEKLARRYGVDMSDHIRDGAYRWHDFASFLAAYDLTASLFREDDDYALLARTYLEDLAREGAIYSEIFVSPSHAVRAGLPPETYVRALGNGIAQAKEMTGIEGRMIVVGIRHFGAEAVEKAAQFAADDIHPLISGFGMAGDENHGHMRDYARAFDIAREAGLGVTVHAGETAGWESVAAALDHIFPTRIGHGVRAIENPDLVRRLADEAIVLEVCPTSNVALNIFPSLAEHPFAKLRAAGCRLTLNADDPPYFHTTLGNEYRVAATHFRLDEAGLRQVTRTAIDAAFVDEATRARLLARL